MVTRPRGELSPPGPSDLNQRYVVSTPAICTCHSESKYYVLWPATDGLDKHLNEQTYDKLVSICGGSSYVEVFDSRDLGVINWRVRLTMEEAAQVSSCMWAEILSPVGAPQECPARNEGSCKPSREKYIAWGTEECWNDHDVAMRGARSLLDIVGHCSRMEATHCRKTSGHPSGVLYWQITILDEQIDAVESIPEVRALDFLSAAQPRIIVSNHGQIREVEVANSSFDPHYDVGKPIPNREKRAMKPSKPKWMPRDLDLIGARMSGGSRFS
ncbi:hypothetical protein CGCFRS4_v014061 [Colletotrichum fructicola]|nr:hypothetical protein CGCFRS4_v014061 [Colletotrichum fructicola]